MLKLNTPGGGGYFLVKYYWGCAAGWGRIFTTGLTIIGFTILVELLKWGRKFSGFSGEENSGKQGFKKRKIRG